MERRHNVFGIGGTRHGTLEEGSLIALINVVIVDTLLIGVCITTAMVSLNFAEGHHLVQCIVGGLAITAMMLFITLSLLGGAYGQEDDSTSEQDRAKKVGSVVKNQSEMQKLIINLWKIEADGTVEYDY